MIRLVCLAAVFAAIFPVTASAWNFYGHESVAYLAWKQMTPDQRAKCTAILKGHPHYSTLLSMGVTLADPEHDEHVFMVAATWPDVIRDKASPDYADHRSTWHYYDVPVTPDGKNVPMPKAEQTTAEAANALQALKMQLFILHDKGATPAKRAKALCWVMHIVGDLHQPLHCVSLYDADFPSGDKGGNSVRLQDTSAAFNLHGLWDGILGQHGTPADIGQASEKYFAEYQPAVAKRGEDLDPVHWVAEGRDLAVKTAYAGLELDNRGELLTKVDRTMVNPDRDYLRRVRDTAREQVVLAGDRLAAVLK